MLLLFCPKCAYIWFYKGSAHYATCPRCHHKFNVQKSVEKADEWLLQKLQEFAQKHPEYAPKVQWAIESLTNPTTTPAQKTAARLWAVSMLKAFV